MQIFKFSAATRMYQKKINLNKENMSYLGKHKKDDFVNVLIKQELTDLYLIQISSLLAIYYKVRYEFFLLIYEVNALNALYSSYFMPFNCFYKLM